MFRAQPFKGWPLQASLMHFPTNVIQSWDVQEWYENHLKINEIIKTRYWAILCLKCDCVYLGPVLARIAQLVN